MRPPGSGRRAGPRGNSATSWEAVYRRPSPETTGTQPSTSTSCEPATGGGQNHICTVSDDGLHQPVPDAERGTAQPLHCLQRGDVLVRACLLRCQSLAGTRLRLLDSIYLPPEAMKDVEVVAALAAAFTATWSASGAIRRSRAHKNKNNNESATEPVSIASGQTALTLRPCPMAD